MCRVKHTLNSLACNHYPSLPDAVVPLILIPPNDLNVTAAESFSLVCSASGYPTPSISWSHNGTAVNGNDGLWIIIVQENSNGSSLSTLSISTAAAKTSGEYTCIVSSPVSDFQTVSSRPVTVLVQGRYISVMLMVAHEIVFNK